MIKVLCKGLDIVELLARDSKKEYSLGEIADTLGMDHGTCANIIKTLAIRGYVQQEGPRRGYRLGYTIYRLVDADMVNEDLVKVAREDMTKLGAQFNEVAILSVIRNDKRVILFQTTPDRDLTVRSTQGKPVYGANTGRVALANYSPVHLEKFIIRVGLPDASQWPEVAGANNPGGELMNQLAEIRKNGFSIQRGNNDIDGFAAPVFRSGHVVAGIGIYLPKSRISNEQKILDAVISTASEITRKLTLTDRI